LEWGGHFGSAEGGQFESATGGHFESATPGQFKSAEGGQFECVLHTYELECFLLSYCLDF
jgi:hypothetical protein